MKKISESKIIRRYSQPPGDPPDGEPEAGSISTFPSSPLDMPTATFDSNLKRREENHQKLIAWIKQNLHPDIDYGRIHIDEQCQMLPRRMSAEPHSQASRDGKSRVIQCAPV